LGFFISTPLNPDSVDVLSTHRPEIGVNSFLMQQVDGEPIEDFLRQ
jgi:hypothetical protein